MPCTELIQATVRFKKNILPTINETTLTNIYVLSESFFLFKNGQ